MSNFSKNRCRSVILRVDGRPELPCPPSLSLPLILQDTEWCTPSGQDRIRRRRSSWLRVRSKMLASYFQRPCSDSLGSLCKITMFCCTSRHGKTTPAGTRPHPFRVRLLILRQVVSAPRLFPPRFPSSPKGKALATCLCLIRTLRRAYSWSVIVPQR